MTLGPLPVERSPARYAVLGVLLSIVGLVSFGRATRALSSGDSLLGGLALAVALGAICWIRSLLTADSREN